MKSQHPLTLHIWGMISRHSVGPMIMFEGVMSRQYYEQAIMKEVTASYIRDHFGKNNLIAGQ